MPDDRKNLTCENRSWFPLHAKRKIVCIRIICKNCVCHVRLAHDLQMNEGISVPSDAMAFCAIPAICCPSVWSLRESLACHVYRRFWEALWTGSTLPISNSLAWWLSCLAFGSSRFCARSARLFSAFIRNCREAVLDRWTLSLNRSIIKARSCRTRLYKLSRTQLPFAKRQSLHTSLITSRSRPFLVRRT